MAGGEKNKITPENVIQKEESASSSEVEKNWKTVSLKEVATDLQAYKRQLPIGDIDIMYATKLLASQEISKLRTWAGQAAAEKKSYIIDYSEFADLVIEKIYQKHYIDGDAEKFLLPESEKKLLEMNNENYCFEYEEKEKRAVFKEKNRVLKFLDLNTHSSKVTKDDYVYQTSKLEIMEYFLILIKFLHRKPGSYLINYDEFSELLLEKYVSKKCVCNNTNYGVRDSHTNTMFEMYKEDYLKLREELERRRDGYDKQE